jgi:hypothetical protein
MYDKSNDQPADGAAVHPLKSLTAAEFMALGGKAVVYVRSIDGARLAEMTGNPEFDDDSEFQLVVSADGSPLLITDSTESVAEWLSDKNFGIVALH